MSSEFLFSFSMFVITLGFFFVYRFNKITLERLQSLEDCKKSFLEVEKITDRQLERIEEDVLIIQKWLVNNYDRRRPKTTSK